MNWPLRFLFSCIGPKPMPVFCFSQVKESTSTRFIYCLMLTVIAVFSALFQSGSVSALLDKYVDSLCLQFNSREMCVRLNGYFAVYRFCLPLAVFHFIMLISTIHVTNSQSWRGKLHNSFWFWKFIFICLLWTASVFFPSVTKWALGYMVVGVVGGMLFIYVQNVFLIDYAYEFNGTWYSKGKKKPIFRWLIYVVAVLLYIGAFIAYAVLLVLWGLMNKCVLNSMIVYVNVCLTGLLLFFSLLSPRLRKKELWLPGAVTAAFVAYLTWSAVLSQPKSVIRGFTVEQQAIHFFSFKGPIVDAKISHQLSLNKTGELLQNYCIPQSMVRSQALEHLSDVTASLGLVFAISMSIYSSMRASLQAKRLGIKTRRQKIKTYIRNVISDVRSDEAKATASADESNKSTQNECQQQASCICFDTVRRSKRRARVLELMHEMKDLNPNVPNPTAPRPLAITSEARASTSHQPLHRLTTADLLNKRCPGLTIPSCSSVPDIYLTTSRHDAKRKNESTKSPTAKTSRIKSDSVSEQQPVIDRRRQRLISDSKRSPRPLSQCDFADYERDLKARGVSRDLLSTISLDDVRLKQARYITAYLTGEEGKHLLHQQEGIAGSLVSFADVLLPAYAPRDSFTLFNEAILTVYSYTWFHFIFCIASLYVMAQLTNWYNPEISSLTTVMESWANMWMKLFSAWLALLLYFWTLLFMRFCFSRRLIQTPLNPSTHWATKEAVQSTAAGDMVSV